MPPLDAIRALPQADDAPVASVTAPVAAPGRAEAVKELSKLKQAAGADYDGEPLGPHPAMAREGLSGPFATGLRAAILKHVGPGLGWR